MIRQETTYYPNTFQIESYKEYYDGVLNVHTKYDKNNNKIYGYFRYDNLEFERKFEVGSKNDTGHVIFYKDNIGNVRIYESNMYFELIKKPLIEGFDIQLRTLGINNMWYTTIDAKAMLIDGVYYCSYFKEKLKNGDCVIYDEFSCEDICYHYANPSKFDGEVVTIDLVRTIDISQYKDLLIKYKIIPVSINYKNGKYFF